MTDLASVASVQEVSEPTKEEKAVAKFLRFNCPTKSTNMMGHRVDYFIGQCWSFLFAPDACPLDLPQWSTYTSHSG